MKFTGISIKKAAAAAAGAAILLVAAPAPAAQAAETCSGWNHYINGEGAANMEVTANLKVGPYSSCGNVTSLPKGTRLFFHCAVTNDYGNLWWWVRVSGTSTYGWMSDDNLDYSTFGGDDNGNGEIVTVGCGQ